MVIGGGGREHALAWKLKQCGSVTGLIASPGNPGIASLAECVVANSGTAADYRALAESRQIDLTVVGPEAPLVAGVVDEFRSHGLSIVGPTQAAARLEGSKIFAKKFLEKAGIPTARSVQVSSKADGMFAVTKFSLPVVVKADGLAAGKGVIIAETARAAQNAIEQLGPRLVIEEFLMGEEVSFIALSDGKRVVTFAPTQDHKRMYDGDQGPNTGGMGAYCDRNILTDQQVSSITETVMTRAVNQMRVDGTPFTGFLYAGLMMTATGPKVLEFNVRSGDPETQALMYSLGANVDLGEILMQSANGALSEGTALPVSRSATTVVVAAKGYPGEPRTGDVISGFENAEARGTTVFQAGTRVSDGQLLTNGGRVLGVTAAGMTLRESVDKAYEGVGEIRFEGMQFRTDIGRRGLERNRK